MSSTTTCEHCGSRSGGDAVLCRQCGTPKDGAEPPKVTIGETKSRCGDCHGLCCVALSFDWPHYKKPAGTPCKHLTRDFKCGIWASLERRGFYTCRGFNCYGAGQATAAMTQRACGSNWRDSPAVASFEHGNFQKAYEAVYAELHDTPPPRLSDPRGRRNK